MLGLRSGARVAAMAAALALLALVLWGLVIPLSTRAAG